MTQRKFQIGAVPATENPEMVQFLQAVKRVTQDAIERVEFLESESASATKNHLTISSGQLQPKVSDAELHLVVNNGAHILLPPSTSGHIQIVYKNGVAAGAIDTSNFTKVVGTPTTTVGKVWLARVTVVFDNSLLEWVQIV